MFLYKRESYDWATGNFSQEILSTKRSNIYALGFMKIMFSIKKQNKTTSLCLET